MTTKLTPEQKMQFTRLCKQMRDLLTDIQRSIPDATLFIEDGEVALYDWPPDVMVRPEPIADGGYWHKASGGDGF